MVRLVQGFMFDSTYYESSNMTMGIFAQHKQSITDSKIPDAWKNDIPSTIENIQCGYQNTKASVILVVG